MVNDDMELNNLSKKSTLFLKDLLASSNFRAEVLKMVGGGSVFSENFQEFDFVKEREDSMAKSEYRKFMITALRNNLLSDKILRFSVDRFVNEKPVPVGGFADRIKGLCTAVLFSIGTGRKLEIEWDSPFPLREIYAQSDFDWEASKRESTFSLHLIDTSMTKIRDELPSLDLLTLIPEEHEVVTVYCNSVERNLLRNNSLLSHFNSESNFTNRDIVGSALSLFKLKPNEREKDLLNIFSALQTQYDYTIGVQFRTGGDGNWNDPKLGSLDDLPDLFKQISKILESVSSESSLIYVTTDSEKIKDIIRRDYSEDFDIVMVDVPIAHMDRSKDEMLISGSRMAVIENHLLSRCNRIVTGRGGFGHLAASRNFQSAYQFLNNE